jgi:hypothetical protein
MQNLDRKYVALMARTKVAAECLRHIQTEDAVLAIRMSAAEHASRIGGTEVRLSLNTSAKLHGSLDGRTPASATFAGLTLPVRRSRCTHLIAVLIPTP